MLFNKNLFYFSVFVKPFSSTFSSYLNIDNYDFDSLQCANKFSVSSCNLLENRLNRFGYFVWFSCISGAIILFYCIVILFALTFTPDNIINFMFDVLDENNTDEMNVNQPSELNEDTIEAGLITKQNVQNTTHQLSEITDVESD